VQHTGIHYSTLQPTATHYNTTYHITTQCNTMQHTHTGIAVCVVRNFFQFHILVQRHIATLDLQNLPPMWWLRLVGSLKLWVSFAKYCLFNRSLLQKRPKIWRGLLIVATPYVCTCIHVYICEHVCMCAYTHVCMPRSICLFSVILRRLIFSISYVCVCMLICACMCVRIIEISKIHVQNIDSCMYANIHTYKVISSCPKNRFSKI